MAEHVLVALTTLGVGAWFGGFVTVFLVSRSSRSALAAPHRVALFREFGRRNLVVAASAMALILVPATVLAYMDPSNTAALVLLVVSIVIAARAGSGGSHCFSSRYSPWATMIMPSAYGADARGA